MYYNDSDHVVVRPHSRARDHIRQMTSVAFAIAVKNNERCTELQLLVHVLALVTARHADPKLAPSARANRRPAAPEGHGAQCRGCHD